MWTPTAEKAKPDKTSRARPLATKPHPKPTRPLWQRLAKWGVIVGAGGLVLAVATVAFVFWMYGRDQTLPDPSSLGDIKHRQVTWIVDKNDRRIGALYGEPKVCAGPPVATVDEDGESSVAKKACDKNEDCDSGKCVRAEHETRTFVPFDKIPRILVDAIVATEDAKFWDHAGLDYSGMFRAFFANLRARKAKEGASTITQQVVKNLLLTPEKKFKRKIQEIILARRLEQTLTKEEILALYINQINYGNARYGVQEAARFYFGKDVGQLDVGEAAMLAGLPQSPERYAPNRKANYEAAKQRQIHVLNRLVADNKLTPAEAQKWIDKPLQVLEKPFPELGSAPEWVGLVKDELLSERCGGKSTCAEGEAYLDTLGATVRTTLDPRLQEDAQRALQAGLRAVDKRHHHGRVKRRLDDDKLDKELAKLKKKLPRSGPAKGETYEAVVTAVHADDKELVVDLGGWEAGVTVDDDRYLVDDEGKAIAFDKKFARGAVIDVVGMGAPGEKRAKHAAHKVALSRGPEGAVVILEVKTRKVRALVGGYATRTLGLNRATDAHRQPGSSFKPYVFAAGIELGAGREKDEGGRITFTAGSPVNDAPEPRWEEKWNAKNYEGGKFEGTVLLRYALAKSINTVSIRVLERVTPARILELAERVGIESKLPSSLSLALGAGEVTPLEMTNALATFAAGGKTARPVVVDSIDGKLVKGGAAKEVVKPEVAYVVTNMMQSVVTSGTGVLAAKLNIPIAGKTGTSNDARDVWFVGLTPDYAIGIWIGHDDPKPMGRETGGSTAVPVFVDIAKAMKLPAKQFPRPPHVVDARIDTATGLLAPEDWPAEKTLTEVFVEGTAPTEYASASGNDVKGEY
jgi:penicillin-binding protein 1A